MDGRIMHHGIIISRWSAATSEIVKHFTGHESDSGKQHYSKYWTFTFTFTLFAFFISSPWLSQALQIRH